MKYVFTIDPVPASRPRVPRFGKPYYLPTYESFRTQMAEMLKGRKNLFTLTNNPLKVEMTFYKRIPKSVSKKRRELMHNDYCVSNVDLDNLEKAIYDSLKGHAYVDDCQIVEHTVSKRWTDDAARIEIILTEI